MGLREAQYIQNTLSYARPTFRVFFRSHTQSIASALSRSTPPASPWATGNPTNSRTLGCTYGALCETLTVHASFTFTVTALCPSF
jgi:hypothetical protein